LFLLRSCTDSFFANRTRPCLLHQIRRCSAPCVGRIDEAGYDELVRDAKDFLSGRSTKIQSKLQALMTDASEAMNFELAAVYRDRLRALTYVQGSQAIHAERIGDADLFALACKSGTMCIQAFFIRGGQNWGHRSFFPAHTNDVPEDEVLQSFLVQFYEEVPPPKLILIDRRLPEADLLCEAFSARAERKVSIRAPERGEQARMIKQAARNAEEELDRRLAETSTQARNLREIADAFELPEPPQRIEVYDNSHVMGTNAVGAMIVAGPEGFRKNQYRKFNIKRPETAPGDDFAMMREVLGRRFARLEKEDPDRSKGDWPDLLLIDGGKGQLSAVCEVLEDAGVHDVPVVAVSKGPDRNAGREIFHLPGGREITFPMNAPLLFYLQRLRDEAHRFAIGAHRQKRAKAFTGSTLDDVPGIGPGRKRALLMHFGTARAVRNAALEDIEKVPGISGTTARGIYDYFHPQG
jgi:excinuclease ABC subunit C